MHHYKQQYYYSNTPKYSQKSQKEKHEAMEPKVFLSTLAVLECTRAKPFLPKGSSHHSVPLSEEAVSRC